jgi:hypothetical protein
VLAIIGAVDWVRLMRKQAGEGAALPTVPAEQLPRPSV